MTKKVTLHDVAERVGVSTQTVSRVVNHKPEVAPDTRERVQEVLDELGYHRRPITRSERAVPPVIGLVIPFEPDALFADPHLLGVIHGIDREVNLRGHGLLLSTARSGSNADYGGVMTTAARSLLGADWIKGAILESGCTDEDEALMLDQAYPVVVVGYSGCGLPAVHPDDEGGAYNLTQHLLALGHRRIGIIRGPEGLLAMDARMRGYLRAFRDAGLPCRDGLMTHGDFTMESGYAGAGVLMDQGEPPTAIFAFNDRMALGVLAWLRERGLRVPDDVSVAGFDGIADGELSTPTLTTVGIFSVELGQRVASLLFEMLSGRAIQAPVIFPTRLLVRSSTGVAPHRA
jgi:DNA-binding LacI/PurR family transcriptional regulator